MNKIEEEKKRAEEELYMALNPAKNKPLAQSANTGYNKKNGGSYTGSTTGLSTEKSPLNTQKTDFAAPKKTTITPQKTEENYFQKARETQRELSKPLPRINDAPKKDESNFSLSTGSSQKKENPFTDYFSKKLNLPSREERNFAIGAIGEESERAAYNDGVVEEFEKAGYLKNTKTQDDFFREGFEGVKKPNVYEFTSKADDNVKKSIYEFLDVGKTPKSRMEAFAKIRNSIPDDEARTTRNAAVERNVLPRMENTPVKGTAADRMMESFKRNHEKAVAEREQQLANEDLPYRVVSQEYIDKVSAELEEAPKEEEKSFWDYAYDVLTVASLIPGLDTFTNIGSAVVNLIRGDYAGAALDLLGAIPFVGEVADGVKYARYVDSAIGFAKMADTAYDTAKYADKAADTVAMAKAVVKYGDEIIDATKVADKVDDAVDMAKTTGQKTSVFDNAEEISKKYPIDKYGNFGQKGKNVQTILSSDPVETSADFYEMIRKGGVERPLDNGKGVRTVFEDGTSVIYRVKTKTPDSPAVNIEVQIAGPIRKQKIHFIKE